MARYALRGEEMSLGDTIDFLERVQEQLVNALGPAADDILADAKMMALDEMGLLTTTADEPQDAE